MNIQGSARDVIAFNFQALANQFYISSVNFVKDKYIQLYKIISNNKTLVTPPYNQIC